MKKVLQAILVIALFVATLGSSMQAEAASLTTVKKISAPKTVTVYTNGTEATNSFKVTYNWTTSQPTIYNANNAVKLDVASSNRGVFNPADVKVASTTKWDKKKKVNVTTATYTITGLKNGKATLTLSAPNNKKSAKVTVNVKTYADGVVPDDYYGEIAVGGTINLKATAYAYGMNPASDSSVKFALGKVYAGGKEVTAKKAKNKLITVSATGKVKAAKKFDTAEVIATSKDGKASFSFIITCVDARVKSFKALINGKTVTSKKNNKYTLYTGAGENELPVLLQVSNAKAEESVNEGDLKISSSNPSVAYYSLASNKIVAKANGKANITFASRLGNGSSVTVAVTVKTKVNSIIVDNEVDHYLVKAGDPDASLLGNGSKYPLGAHVNADASNKALKYSVKNVYDASGKAVANKNVKKYIAVDKKGVVTTKKACSADVVITAGTNKVDLLTKTVHVVADKAVTKITFNNKKKTTSLSRTVYFKGDKSESDVIIEDFTDLLISGDADNDTLEYTSSNEDIADFDSDHKVHVYVDNNETGKAVLTAKATDGSGKKVTYTVNVKIDANEIFVDKASTDEEGNYILYVPAGKNLKVASVIDAKVNSNAAVKGVTYSAKEVKVAKDKTKVITVKAADTRKNTKATQATAKVILVAVSNAAKDFVISLDFYNEEGYAADSMKAGEYGRVVADKTFNDQSYNDVATNAFKFTSLNTKIATVDAKTGTVKALKPGTAKIKAEYGNSSKTIEIKVGRSDATVKSEIDKAVTAGLKVEDRTYLGVKASFDAKKSAVNAEIVDIYEDPTAWRNTGVVNLLKTLPTTVKEAEIEASETYTIKRVGAKAVVTVNGGEEKTFDDVLDGVEYIRELLDNECGTLADLAGKKYDITVTSEEDDFVYVNAYTLNFDLADAVIEDIMDQRVDAAVNDLVYNESVAYPVANVSNYDWNKNSFVIDVRDEEESVEELVDVFFDNYFKFSGTYYEAEDALRKQATKITVNVFDSKDGEKYAHVEEDIPQGELLTRAQLTEYVDRAFDKFEDKSLKNFARKTFVISADYKFGDKTYTYSGSVQFNVGKAAHEYKINKKINEAIDAKSGKFGDVKVEYFNGYFTITVNENDANKSFAGLFNSDLKTLFTILTGDSTVKNALAINAYDGGIKTVAGADLTDITKIFSALTGEAADAKYSSLVDKYATVQVTYTDGSTLEYKVLFNLEKNPDPIPDPIPDVTDNDVTNNQGN